MRTLDDLAVVCTPLEGDPVKRLLARTRYSRTDELFALTDLRLYPLIYRAELSRTPARQASIAIIPQLRELCSCRLTGNVIS